MKPRRRAPRAPHLLAFLSALAGLGCGGPGEPRFAEVTVSSAAPSATLSGSTRGVAPAIELSPGCPGYLDPSAPEHLVHLTDATAVTITARSTRGPLAIVVSGEGEVRCDSDQGAGHAPHVTIAEPGDYAVYVASLHDSGGDLPYELTMSPALGPDPGQRTTGDRVQVSVTVTSDPPGATVRTAEGQVLGTTPAMFVITIPPSEIGSERRYVLEMPGRRSTEVTGRLMGGAVVLHATMPGGGPGIAQMGSPPAAGHAVASAGELVVTASNAQRIRDYGVARQPLDVANECTITRATVDVDIRHSFIGDLRVVLRSPRGTQVTLHDHGGGSRANLVSSFDWSARRGALQALAGENARGRWEMAVHDDAGADTGTFRSFTLRLGCREGALAGASSVTQETVASASEVQGTFPPPAAAPTRRAQSSSPRVRTTRPVVPRRAPPPPGLRDPFAARPPQPPPQPPQPLPPQPWRSPTTTGRTNGAGRTIVAPME